MFVWSFDGPLLTYWDGGMRITGIALSPPDPAPSSSSFMNTFSPSAAAAAAGQYESFSASNGNYRSKIFNGSTRSIGNDHWPRWTTRVDCTENGQGARGEAGGGAARGSSGVGSSSSSSTSGRGGGGGMMNRSTNGRDRYHQLTSPSAGGASCAGGFLRCV